VDGFLGLMKVSFLCDVAAPPVLDFEGLLEPGWLLVQVNQLNMDAQIRPLQDNGVQDIIASLQKGVVVRHLQLFLLLFAVFWGYFLQFGFLPLCMNFFFPPLPVFTCCTLPPFFMPSFCFTFFDSSVC
jgi:hypothetical protein